MTDPTETEDAREADDMGEKPDLGRTPDALAQALTGSDSGSDTRAGSLRGGAASGSDDDPDQERINASLASEGMASAAPEAPSSVEPGTVKNTGVAPGEADPGSGSAGADAATG